MTSSTSANWITNAHITGKFNAKVKNAEERGYDMTITRKEWKAMWLKNGGWDDLTGEKLTTEIGMTNTASVDRLDNRLGYVQGNLCITGVRNNLVKSFVAETKTCSKDITLTVTDKKNIIKMSETLYNPIKMKELKEKYSMTEVVGKGGDKEIVKESTQETVVEIKAGNPEIEVARNYAGLGSLLEKNGIEFQLTYTQYRHLMNRRTCAITKRKILDTDVKTFYQIDKTLPICKDNILLTTVKIQQALDKFILDTSITKEELLSMGEALSK